jgi:hypothetical protein
VAAGAPLRPRYGLSRPRIAAGSASVWVLFLAESRALLPLWLYPIKIGVVLGALVYGWCQDDELRGTPLLEVEK